MSARGLPREPFCQLFRNLDEVTVGVSSESGPEQTASPRRDLLPPGETVDSLYLLKAGLAKASGTTASGNEVLLDWIYPGDAFGMEALLSTPMNHVWSIRADEASEALEWDKATMAALRHAVRTFTTTSWALSFAGITNFRSDLQDWQPRGLSQDLRA